MSHTTGFRNGVMVADNVDFSGNGPPNTSGNVVADGQLLIGSSVAPFLAPALLTSLDGSVTFTVGHNTIDISSAGGSHPPIETLSDDLGIVVTPSSNNIHLVGHVVEQGATKFSTVTAGSHLLNINPMSASRWIVDPLGFNGTHTTIATALTSATAGDTIFIMPGTYTENLTLKHGVQLAGYDYQGGSGLRTKIVGKLIDNGGVVNATLTNIALQTNSDNVIALTGSGSSWVLNGCLLNCTNNTGISTAAGTNVFLYECTGDLGTTGIGYWTGAGSINCFFGTFTNSGASLAASTTSGSVVINDTSMSSALSTSSSGAITGTNVSINCGTINTTALTTAGTGATSLYGCALFSGTASAISVGTGTTVNAYQCTVSSSNTNAITGAGTINTSAASFISSSANINTTTQSVKSYLSVIPRTAKAHADSSYTVLSTDYFLSVDTSGGVFTALLPNAPSTNQVFIIKDRTGNAAASNITVTTVGGAINIDGSTSYLINFNYGSITVVFNGTSYEII